MKTSPIARTAIVAETNVWFTCIVTYRSQTTVNFVKSSLSNDPGTVLKTRKFDLMWPSGLVKLIILSLWFCWLSDDVCNRRIYIRRVM